MPTYQCRGSGSGLGSEIICMFGSGSFIKLRILVWVRFWEFGFGSGSEQVFFSLEFSLELVSRVSTLVSRMSALISRVSTLVSRVSMLVISVACLRWSVACQRWSVACRRWSVTCRRWSVACQHWSVCTLCLEGLYWTNDEWMHVWMQYNWVYAYPIYIYLF
jgi:hypothetical protein